jgi:hypothetical protein
MRYILKNPDCKFVAGIEIYIPGDRAIDIRIGASKVEHPLAWAYPAYRMKRNGEWTTVDFERPDNWTQFEMDITSEQGISAAGRIVYLEPISEEEITILLSEKRIVFLGAARNCAGKITESINRVLDLAKYFKEYRIKIFENDSSDATPELISDSLKGNDNAEVFTEKNLCATLPSRTQRLAHARNRLLDATIEQQANFDYVCWLDLDGLVDSRFTNEGFLSNFKYEELWGGVFPISHPVYYDVWALREKSISPSDIAWHGEHQVPSVIKSRRNLHAAVQQLTKDNLIGWLSVESAFGGFGIYKMKIAGQGRYVGLIGDEEICEHVPYNESLGKAGARLFINPECITHQ